MSQGSSSPDGEASFPGEEWRKWRARLDAVGFHPSKRLGQNFLLDPNLLGAIARDAQIGTDDRVIEVGTGLGFLTRALLTTGASVVSIEVDRRLHELVQGDLGDRDRLELVRADALAGKHALSPELIAVIPTDESWHLVGNLPYSVSGPLLAECARADHPPASMTVLVQKEMAERVSAGVGEPGWGLLGMRLQLSYSVRRLRALGGTHFWPRPRVDSALIRLERRPDAPSSAVQQALKCLSGALFGRRRQVVRRVLADTMGDREAALGVLEEVGIDGQTRVEALQEGDWLALAGARDWTGIG
jgi:16S rRNA (adenine1518-N6/adenine1519-N6)-dimethyltransferase